MELKASHFRDSRTARMLLRKRRPMDVVTRVAPCDNGTLSVNGARFHVRRKYFGKAIFMAMSAFNDGGKYSTLERWLNTKRDRRFLRASAKD